VAHAVSTLQAAQVILNWSTFWPPLLAAITGQWCFAHPAGRALWQTSETVRRKWQTNLSALPALSSRPSNDCECGRSPDQQQRARCLKGKRQVQFGCHRDEAGSIRIRIWSLQLEWGRLILRYVLSLSLYMLDHSID
jgi:hypothetical protein